jgi:ribonuclease HI
MYFDGSYTLKGAGAGVILIPPEGDILKYAIQLGFPATNNIAEYEGLVTGLQVAKDLGIRRLLIQGDSQLVAKQVQKEYDCNNDKMAEYLAEVRRLEKFFDGFEVRYVPRLDNRDTDHLVWIASSRAPTPARCYP